MRVRGLKRRNQDTNRFEVNVSHPMRVRGLKLRRLIVLNDILPSRTPCGCVD